MSPHTVCGRASIVLSAILIPLISTPFLLAAILVFPTTSSATEKFETPVGFSVSPTGAATFSIPIEVSPGTAGMAPNLSLNYNSQGGNGLLGMGWGLGGLSAIYRCGRTIIQDGVNSGVGYTADDRFCLDGERLVVVANASGATGVYGANLTEYRTERESFTRIVSYGTTGSGPTYFIAQTKDGHVIEFGNTTDSRVEAQGKTDIRVWAVDKISDLSGNYMAVSYTEDGTTLRSTNANGDYYPLRIDYSGNAAAGLSPYNSVRFAYQTRPDNAPSYLGGSVIQTMLRMSNVRTYANVNHVDTLFKDYQLGYLNSAAPNNASRLVSVKECLGDDSTCLPVTQLDWLAATGTTTATKVTWSSFNCGSNPTCILADFNGDGLADILALNIHTNGDMSQTTSVTVRYSTGSGWGSTVNLGSFSGAGFGAAGDINGDGLADIITPLGVYLSNGSGFTQVTWNGFNCGYNPTCTLADFNGDGLADVLALTTHTNADMSQTTSVSVKYSVGNGWGSTVNLGSFSGTGFGAAGDINGDGLADIITPLGVYLYNGSGFTQVTWNGFNCGSNPTCILADFNGDGLADILALNIHTNGDMSQTTSVTVRYSTGSGWGSTVNLGSFSGAGSGAAGDIDGDGKADAITTLGVHLGTVPTPDLLNSVTTGLGNNTSVSYQLISNSSVYAPDMGAVFPVRDLNVKLPLNVVASDTVPDGIGGTRTTNFKYYGAKTHLLGGGFLGFRQYDVTDGSTLIKTSTTFRQDYPLQGLPTSVVQTQSNGNVLHSVANTWSVTTYSDTALPLGTANGNSTATPLTSKHHYPAVTQSIENTYDLSGVPATPLTTVTSNTAYDGYGNATTVTTSTTDGFSKLITNTYASPDLTKWILGRLTKSTVQSTTP